MNDFVAVDFDKQLPFAVGIEQHPAAMPKQFVMMLLAYSNSQPVPLIVESLKCQLGLHAWRLFIYIVEVGGTIDGDHHTFYLSLRLTRLLASRKLL